MKKSIIISAICIGLAGVSCSSILDDEHQLGGLGSETYYANATDEDALSLISSIYLATEDTRGGMDSYTDDIASPSSYEDENADGFNGGLNLATLYNINYQANLIIERLADDTEAKRRVIAEAYFFRGWAYFNLIRGWGTPPLVDHVLGSDELQPANATKEELWNYVQSSFDEAIAGLPSKSGKGAQEAFGARVSKEVALAYKGKAYLYAGDNASAAAALRQVIDSNLYELYPDYTQLYTKEADFCDEYMWEYNAADADDDMRSVEARYAYQSQWRAENVIMPGGSHLSGFVQGYSTTAPSADFYNLLVSRGEVGTPRQRGTAWTIEEAAQMFVTLSGDDYVNSPNYEGNNLAPYIARGLTPYQAGFSLLWKDFTKPELGSNEGYLQAKFYIWHSDMYTALVASDIYSKANQPVLRYSDVLLMYAEATLDSQAGLSAINAVRQRAGLDPLASYTLKDVQDERRVEFWDEGERWFDCVRWGIAKDTFKAAQVGQKIHSCVADGNSYTYTITESTNENCRGWNDRYLLFPYPTSELAQNKNLKQNPGW